MRHYFEFDGVKSSDFGVFISGQETMGAAGRDVDEIIVPGMDGNLTIDNGRFNAVAHTYPAFIAETAKANLQSLRNALLSKRGHKRLSDTVHPDEFYRAYYERGVEPEVTANLRHSELEIEFTRDPRRFLVSGDTPQAVAVNTETLSGSVVTFDSATGADRITGLSVSIMAEQSGSGDPSPTNIRQITGWGGAEIAANGDTYTVTWSDAGTVYGGTLDVVRGKLTATHQLMTVTNCTNGNASYAVKKLGNLGYGDPTGVTLCNALKQYSGTAGSIPADSFLMLNSGGYNAFQIDMRFAAADSATTPSQRQSLTNAILAQMESDGHPLQIVFKLTNPVEYDVTPINIATVMGENNISADCGDVTVTLTTPATLNNPTLFPSSPKIRVYGQGTLYIGNMAITVGGSFPYVDIDTEIADCSYDGQNANQYVTFSGVDFPKLEPGVNYVTYTGFSDVEITPRWWRL